MKLQLVKRGTKINRYVSAEGEDVFLTTVRAETEHEVCYSGRIGIDDSGEERIIMEDENEQ